METLLEKRHFGMIYIPLEALQANTQGVRPDDMRDGGQTSTIL